MFLRLNPSKVDLTYFSKHLRLIQFLPAVDISSNLSITSSSTIHSLVFPFDSSLSLVPKIKYVAKSSFFHLQRIQQMKISADNPTFKLLVSSLVLSRFDSSYYGLPETTLYLLTKAFNNSIRLDKILRSTKSKAAENSEIMRRESCTENV